MMDDHLLPHTSSQVATMICRQGSLLYACPPVWARVIIWPPSIWRAGPPSPIPGIWVSIIMAPVIPSSRWIAARTSPTSSFKIKIQIAHISVGTWKWRLSHIDKFKDLSMYITCESLHPLPTVLGWNLSWTYVHDCLLKTQLIHKKFNNSKASDWYEHTATRISKN